MASLKGVWKELSNPFRDHLVAALEKIGTHGASALVDQALATKGVESFRNIFVKAEELVNKPDALRNELAAVVEGSNFRTEADRSVIEAMLVEKLAAATEVSLAGSNGTANGSEQVPGSVLASDGVSKWRSILSGITRPNIR
jgi:hypothetical protein